MRAISKRNSAAFRLNGPATVHKSGAGALPCANFRVELTDRKEATVVGKNSTGPDLIDS